MKRPQRAATKIVKARTAGCKRPIIAWTEAERAGIPYYILCAYLEQDYAVRNDELRHKWKALLKSPAEEDE